jgi:hypothetical protein
VSKFDYAFDEHTKFVRQIFSQTGYASNPNQVLQDENMVLSIQSKDRGICEQYVNGCLSL